MCYHKRSQYCIILNQIKKKLSGVQKNTIRVPRANQSKSISSKQSHEVIRKIKKTQLPSTAVNTGLASRVSARDEDIAV